MTTNIAINGMGRIGRMVLRIALKNKDLNVVAINASYPPETIAHLINYDTTHGVYDFKVEPIESGIKVDDHEIQLVSDRNPENLPWKQLDIDVAIEATGKFNHGDKAIAHIKAGAKKVLLTGPSKGGDVQMIVKGVNNDQLDIEKYDIFSNASCTTNCIGPVAKVLNDQFGIQNGLMTTVHAITNDQNNIDNPHKDLRRARSCNESIIPTSTGAAKALKEVLPELEGKLHGMALRVPTKNVSLVDLVVDLNENVTATQVNEAFEANDLQGVISTEDAPLVSMDFNTNPHSAIIDTQSTMVMGDNKVKVIAWYDNEWGYSNRVVDVATQIGQLLKNDVAAVAN
ncbi:MULTISPECIES: type I glyceraldehyde-3-phosphate dehydrogenase [Staphylococcus]|uniref:Glyceraldehyde-3-phosphate dehydrogenase n=1 Tax=Staphylococcus saprophyticus subsp. saprophyticus (strain ATCC 15305 / DSM 20229 / NCIMB 8711 / NCTC 7292 / S-41) TaxID=342451 RepID=Q49YB8_STAS1|nr:MULTISPECIES: type I glyceraldehyde-3-phosphate dehydrogenase [Staphylococcus]CRV16176.1 glyceraldehyde-3-phosphate dehydrogenase [Streptococcus equi subsp. equi]ASF17945.1 type I glyceraldehyde-3-phosphate dehydrogenase [Staphylococcus saprophyticus]MBN6755349.1 type I glyceraldehyde-3-phosphate dehydrogenase [Staphylococcus saprophyticus]MBN6765327.1 type I glyceraldehyde-3-phosphate dehydrogenase [Staphylococcus saprophyticus]MBN6770133.1 type I glyceraldehyde-3-phosphate dehydrogenase [